MISPLPRSQATTLRIMIAVLFLVAISGFIFLHRSELDSLAYALRSGRWSWLLLAAAIEVLYFLTEAFYFSRSFHLTGTPIPSLSVLPVLLGAQTLSVVVPSEFLADQSLFFFYAKRHRHSPSQVALGVSLAELAELLSFMVVLVVGFLFLILSHSVQPFEIAAGYGVLLFCSLLGAAAVFLLWRPGGIAAILTTVQRLLERGFRIFGTSSWLSQERAGQLNRRLMEGITIARQDPHGLAVLLVLALAGHLLRIICLFAVLQAFGLSAAPWKIATAYAVGTLVWIASPIPGGIGLVEGAYSFVFVSLGIPPGAAATLALVYRGVTFWLPLGMGIIALRILSIRKEVL